MSDSVDVLYIIGRGSVNGNAELKYSLRTLARHGRNIGRVIISGDIPDFIGGQAITIPCHDISINGKHWNMMHKILKGIREAKLSEPFLFSCDDHFFDRDFDAMEWPIIDRGRIYTEAEWEHRNGRPCGKYQRAIAATGELLRSNGYPDTYTVWHGNMWIDPNYTDRVDALLMKHRGECIYGYEPIMVFNAMYLADHPETTVKTLRTDVKAKTFDEAMSYASAYGFFSTSDKAWRNGDLIRWFKKEYKEKSPWEK